MTRPENPKTSYYELRKHNFTTNVQMEVHPKKVRGLERAEIVVDELNRHQLSFEERQAGISWYLNRTSRPR